MINSYSMGLRLIKGGKGVGDKMDEAEGEVVEVITPSIVDAWLGVDEGHEEKFDAQGVVDQLPKRIFSKIIKVLGVVGLNDVRRDKALKRLLFFAGIVLSPTVFVYFLLKITEDFYGESFEEDNK